LLRGEHLKCPIDEQIVYNQLDNNEAAIWSLLLASGYLKVIDHEEENEVEYAREALYELALTNYEVERMFNNMIRSWFRPVGADYNDFVKALLLGDVDAMNVYMNRVTLSTFSYFDTGKSLFGAEPERFYHGFVLGMMVDLQDRYIITSNRESGFGRYDVMLELRNPETDDAIILEFKVRNERREENLEETLKKALEQIEEKDYAASLQERGIPREHIRKIWICFLKEKTC